MIKSSYVNGSFWNNFSIVKALPDGHCIMSSIVSCLNNLHTFKCNADLMISSLVEEYKHFERYRNYYVDAVQRFCLEMKEYVDNRCYDSLKKKSQKLASGRQAY